jgi:SAM-dependent methyltransferase
MSGDMSQTLFERNWEIYNRIIECNGLRHAELIAEWQKALTNAPITNTDAPVTIADIGAGDCSIPCSVLKACPSIKVKKYTAVDLAAAPLVKAKIHLENAIPSCSSIVLVQADMLSWIDTCIAEGTSYDIILTSLCVHHLTTEKKQQFLQKAKNILNPNGGLFLWADVYNAFPSDKQLSRQELFDIWEDHLAPLYHTLTPEEIKGDIFGHIREFDYPEPLESYEKMVKEAGFTFEVLYKDGFYIWTAALH